MDQRIWMELPYLCDMIKRKRNPTLNIVVPSVPQRIVRADQDLPSRAPGYISPLSLSLSLSLCLSPLLSSSTIDVKR